MRRKDETPGQPAERRKARKPVLLTGIIASAGGDSSLDCTIRDLSETGARIVPAKGAQCPDEFYLINVRDRVAYKAKLVRSEGLEAGIVFQKTLPLAAVTDPALGFLKKMWLSKATR